MENIRVEDPEQILSFDPLAIGAQGAGAAQQLLFFRYVNAYIVLAALAQESEYGISLSMQVDQNLFDAELFAHAEPNGQHRHAPNWHQAFGDAVCDRPESSAVSGGQEESFHGDCDI